VHKNDSHGSKDVDGCILPTLVYMAREKRPQYHTHFKAGAINSLVVHIISTLHFLKNNLDMENDISIYVINAPYTFNPQYIFTSTLYIHNKYVFFFT